MYNECYQKCVLCGDGLNLAELALQGKAANQYFH